MKVTLQRKQQSTVQTTGILVIDSKHAFATVELGWNDNKTKKSCIPAGTYKVIKRNSPKYGDHFHIQDVPKRNFILIHAANFSRQLQGCIAPGLAHADIDKDGLQDVTSSKVAMKSLNKILPNEFELTILNP